MPLTNKLILFSYFIVICKTVAFADSSEHSSAYLILNDLDKKKELSQKEYFTKSNDIESYAEWKCFNTKIEHPKISCDKIKYIPRDRMNKQEFLLEVTTSKYIFSSDPIFKKECKVAWRKLKNIISTEDKICIYSAYLQMMDDDDNIYKEYRIFEEIKSNNFRYILNY